MPNILDDALKLIGLIVALGGDLGAVCYKLFQTFGERWMNAKFEERLAAYKHAQQRELEELKLKISMIMDRTVKLHQKEFEVLPESWGLLFESFEVVRATISRAQQYPNLDGMRADELDEFLEQSPLAKWQRAELKGESKKLAYYIRIITAQRANDAKSKCNAFYVFFTKTEYLYHMSLRRNLMRLTNLYSLHLASLKITIGMRFYGGKL